MMSVTDSTRQRLSSRDDDDDDDRQSKTLSILSIWFDFDFLLFDGVVDRTRKKRKKDEPIQSFQSSQG